VEGNIIFIFFKITFNCKLCYKIQDSTNGGSVKISEDILPTRCIF